MRTFSFSLIAFLSLSFAAHAQKVNITNNKTVMIEKSGSSVNFMVVKSDKWVYTKKWSNCCL
ncbi:MAG: hypothetical protein FWF72_00420 [Paludibacter sp.]|nr:hypothetical protein [Paludibacter sp.]